MQYNVVTYVADQIIGYLKEGRPRGERAGIVKADYPSSVEKPCDVYISYTRDDSFFFVGWFPPNLEGRDSHPLDNQTSVNFDDAFIEASKEHEKAEPAKEGHITVHVKESLERIWLRHFAPKSRKKFAKRNRAEAKRHGDKLRNVIIVSPPFS